MYPKFIEVHNAYSEQKEYLINVDAIKNVYVDHNGITVISFGIGYVDIAETYEEAKALIVDCGCYINKGDPRLDTENRLTEQMIMDEGMVGEPVWNTNKGRWYIIANWSNLKDDFLMELQGIYDILRYTAEDLKKFPLYRMKR